MAMVMRIDPMACALFYLLGLSPFQCDDPVKACAFVGRHVATELCAYIKIKHRLLDELPR